MSRLFSEVNGTWYDDGTPMEVIDVLENVRLTGRIIRIRIHYGDVMTGRDWGDSSRSTGYVGRSTGLQKIPLLIHNKRSRGGDGILDHCIVRIAYAAAPHHVLYQHPTYHIKDDE